MTDTKINVSTVATAYIYERLHHILDNENNEVLLEELSGLYRELSATFHTDTGVKIGVHLGWNKVKLQGLGE